MQKVYGSSKRQDGLYSIGRNKWELIYGFGEDENGGWNWRERFIYKPSLSEVESTIIDAINKATDERILSGFQWNDMPVWLSTENQANYKAAYDLAVQKGGKTLPVRFKFGTDDRPIYHIFKTLEELEDFYMACISHVESALNDGWDEKDNVRENIDKFQ